MKNIGSEFYLEPEIFSHRRENWKKHFPKKNKIFLSTGSDAIVFLVKVHNIKKILIPTYIEKEVLKLIQEQKVKIKFYKINKDLTIDIKNLQNDDNFDSILIIHYFGYPQCMLTLKKKCKQLNLQIIEDCVQSMLSSYKGKPLGTFGDASFNSLRKFIGIPDGSIVISNQKIRLLESKNHKKFIKKRFESILGKYYYLNGNSNYSNYYFKESFVNAEKYHNKYEMPAPMSSLSSQILDYIDFDFIKKRRRQNFRYLLKHLKKISFFKKLPNNVCPLGFPIIIKNREQVRKKLIENGIFPPIHWKIKFNDEEIFSDAEMISKSILTIPIDQRYTILDMKQIVDVFKKLRLL